MTNARSGLAWRGLPPLRSGSAPRSAVASEEPACDGINPTLMVLDQRSGAGQGRGSRLIGLVGEERVTFARIEIHP